MKSTILILIIVSITCCWASEVDYDNYYTEEEFHEAQRKYREGLCANNNETLHEELAVCFKIENHTLHSDAQKCRNSTSHTTSISFWNAACANASVFDIFDECMAPLKDGEDYYEKPDFEGNEGLICARNVLDKYGLTHVILY